MITEVAALSARLRVAVVQYEKKKYYYKNQNTHTPSCTRQSVAASWPQVDTEHRQHIAIAKSFVWLYGDVCHCLSKNQLK